MLDLPILQILYTEIMESVGRITRDVFPDGHGGDIEICTCGLPWQFSHQSNIQVKIMKCVDLGLFFFGQINSPMHLICVAGSLPRAPCLSIGSWMRIGRWESPILVNRLCTYDATCRRGGWANADDCWEQWLTWYMNSPFHFCHTLRVDQIVNPRWADWCCTEALC